MAFVEIYTHIFLLFKKVKKLKIVKLKKVQTKRFRQSRQCNQRHKNNCGVDYIGETVRNLVAVRIAEHSNPAHTSEPAKHLREYPSHSFTWRVLSSA